MLTCFCIWNWNISRASQNVVILVMINDIGKVRGPSFEETWVPITRGCFVPSLVKIGPVVLEKKSKIWKVYRQMDRQTDRQTDGRQAIRKAHWSFQLRWAKNTIQIKNQLFCFNVYACVMYLPIFIQKQLWEKKLHRLSQ